MQKIMNHGSYQTECRSKSEAALRFTISDAQAAILANQSNQNNGYYQDEVCYAAQELRRRGIVR